MTSIWLVQLYVGSSYCICKCKTCWNQVGHRCSWLLSYIVPPIAQSYPAGHDMPRT